MKVMQWEYKYEPSFADKNTKSLGEQGWEAVGITSNGCVLYKRPAGIIDIQGKYEQKVEKTSPDQVE